MLGAKTREEESKWRRTEIRRRTPAPKVVKVEEKEERDPSVPQYGPYDVLQYHSGSKGRREFFRIQKAAHARPALSEETCLKMEDEPDLYEGACFRNFVRFASRKGLVLDPFLSRVDADKRSLDLTGMALGDSLGEAVASSLPRLPGLERLSLAGNRLSDKTLAPLLDGLVEIQDLRSIDLSENDLDAKGAKALQQLLAQRSCLLTEVHLRRSDVDDDECRALCESLELNTASKLEVLDLSDNLIGQKEEVNEFNPEFQTGGEALGAMLSATSTLTVLDLSWNSIRGTSAKALASAVKKNATLTLLNLSHNRLDEDGGVAIADALEANTSLIEVRMAHCFIGAKGSIVLSQALTERATPLTEVDFSGNVPGRVGAAALLRAVRSLRGATQLSIVGCDCGRIYDVFDASDPGGEWDLETDDPYEFCVMRSLLKLANASDACRLATVKVSGSQVRLARDEAEPSIQKLWKAVLASIDARKVPDLTEILVAYGLDPPHSAVRALSEGVLSHISNQPTTTTKSGKEVPQPATIALVWDGVFRTACSLADADASNSVDASEASTICLDLLGVELCDASKLIREASSGGSSCSFEEFATYASQTFARQTPVLKPSPLLDGSDVWKVPRDEVLYVDVELEPSFHLPTDKGSRGLAAMIKCCLTDEERLQMIETAGKGFSRREAQDILDACAPSSGHLDAPTKYNLCKALAPSISTGCASFLARNLTERQHLQLRCELGPLWNMYVGMVDGHYAFDTTKDVEALTLLASKCKLDLDTSMNQNRNPWRNGIIRVPVAVDANPGDVVEAQANGETMSVTVPLTWQPGAPLWVSVNGDMTLETALKAPAAEGEDEAEDEDAPKGRIVAFDVSCAAPVAKDARPLSNEAFAAVKARLRCVEWRHSSNAKPESDAEHKREVASVKRKQASLAYAAAVAKGEDASMPDDTTESIGLAVLSGEDLLEVDDVPDAPEHLGVLAEKVSRALGAPEAVVLQGLVASRAHASELIASSPHGLDTVRLDATGGALDEEEEEFDGASIQLTDGNERRATVAETRVKHPCRIYVGRTGTGCFLEGNDPLPGDYGLAWLLVRLAHLEVIASTTYFTAAQAFDLYEAMPSGDAWAEVRMKLLVILFSRVVDADDFCARCNDLPLTDSLRLRHRLGILNLWDPRHSLKNGILRLSRKDDRLVAKTVLALAGGGSEPAFANGQFREAEDPMVLGGWAPPPEGEWAEMDPADMSETKLPRQGTLTFSATADPGPSGESFLDLVGCGRERPAGVVFLV